MKSPLNTEKTYFGLPEEVVFCKKCVISNQRPNSAVEYQHNKDSLKTTIAFGEDGICDACRFTEKKKQFIVEQNIIIIPLSYNLCTLQNELLISSFDMKKVMEEYLPCLNVATQTQVFHRQLQSHILIWCTIRVQLDELSLINAIEIQ